MKTLSDLLGKWHNLNYAIFLLLLSLILFLLYLHKTRPPARYGIKAARYLVAVIEFKVTYVTDTF
jgi:hypothetical protein